MCRSNTHIKLCTCEGLNFSKGNSWQLNKSASKHDIVGSFIQSEGPRLFDFSIFSVVEDKLLFDINNYDVFDFEYRPQENDLLTINVEMNTFVFIHDGQKFSTGESFSLKIASEGKYLRSGKVKISN